MKYYSQIPKPIADQIILGGEMTDGLTKDAAELNIKQIDAAQMKATTDALVSTDDLFNKSRSAQTVAYQAFHADDDALTQFISDTTGALVPFYGKRWNTEWAQVGFITPTIMVPKTINDRFGLALRMANFLTANPDKEAPNQGVTAANGTALRAAAIATQRLATAADKDLENKGTARQAASDALTSNMRLLIGLLSEILNQDDPRWLDFGLEKPAKLLTPGAPIGLAVAASPSAQRTDGTNPDTTTVLLTWDATPFATRYRVRMRFVGVLGSNYQLVASVTEPMAQIDVPVNATVEFTVQAVNGNRQSVASDVAVYQPAVTPTAATVAAAAVEHAVVPTVANGSNGHTNGSLVRR